MAKTKFILTHDLVKVEPEPDAYQAPMIVPASLPVQEPVDNPVAVASTPANSRAVDNAAPGPDKHTEKNHVNEASRAGEGRPFFETVQAPVHHRGNTTGQSDAHDHDNDRGRGDQQGVVQGRGQGALPEIIRDQFNLKIDRDIKRDFRIWCLQHHQSMTEALEDALRFYMTHKGDQ